MNKKIVLPHIWGLGSNFVIIVKKNVSSGDKMIYVVKVGDRCVINT